MKPPRRASVVRTATSAAEYQAGCLRFTVAPSLWPRRLRIVAVGGLVIAPLLADSFQAYMLVVTAAGATSLIIALRSGAELALSRICHRVTRSLKVRRRERADHTTPGVTVAVDGRRLKGLGAPSDVLIGLTPGVRQRYGGRSPDSYALWLMFERGAILVESSVHLDHQLAIAKLARRALGIGRRGKPRIALHTRLFAGFVLILAHLIFLVVAVMVVATGSDQGFTAFLCAIVLVALDFTLPSVYAHLLTEPLAKRLQRELGLVRRRDAPVAAKASFQ